MVGGQIDQPLIGGVLEGPQHAGDVAQRGIGPTPLLQRLSRLAFEVDEQPVLRRAEHLPQVQIAVDPLHRDLLARELAVPLLDQRGVPAEVGHGCGGGLQPLEHGVDGKIHRGRAEFGGQRGMHGGHRLAQPVGLAGEVAADLVGVEVTLGEQVARAGRGHVPALGAVRGELGHHAQRTGLGTCSIPGGLVRAEQRRDVRVTGPGQHPVQLDVGVDARGEATEHLEHRPVLEDDAGVALLDPRHARNSGRRQVGARFLLEAQSADGGRRIDQGQQLLRRIGIVERIAGHPFAVGSVDGSDGGEVAVLVDRLGAPAQQHLVPLCAAVGVGHVEQHQFDAVGQRGDGGRSRGDQFSAAPGIPALADDPVGERQIVDGHHCSPPSVGSGRSMNQ